jgi:hypothetical protein
MADLDKPTGDEIIGRLQKGKLPQMVDWIDPAVLGMVAVRTLISTTIGSYADQRPMQEAMDGERNLERLALRHDYSKLDVNQPGKIIPPDGDPNNPNCDPRSNPSDPKFNTDRPVRRLSLDKQEAFWVDFIADLGDGFEATYAMAYLLAQSSLDVQGSKQELPAGQILIFGGDLAYPNATLEEYRTRCVNPYNWAFTADQHLEQPRRELFFIAGNHDWYDGLAAFSNQFCYESSALGGWRCKQERSYFAIKLPYDWWIWGIDVALGDSLDLGQVHYFENVAHRMHAGDKVVIILHAPDWLKPHYDALARICRIARQVGEVCAIIAGDLHHYSRYESQSRNPPLHLITSGGGGAFAHATHDRKNSIDVDLKVAGTGPVAHAHHAETSASAPKPAPTSEEFRANRHFYPTKIRSRLLSLKNLWLPFHNKRFALFLGVIYMVYAWVFQISVADPTVALKKARYVSIEMQCLIDNPGEPAKVDVCNTEKKTAFDNKLAELTTPKDEPSKSAAAAKSTPPASAMTDKAKDAKQEIDTGMQKFRDNVQRQGGWLNYFWGILSVQFTPDRVFSGMLDNPAFFLMVAGLWVGLVGWADVTLKSAWLRWPAKLAFGTAHAGAHLTALLATNSVLGLIYNFSVEMSNFMAKVAGVGLYTILMVLIGGILGALIVGFYFVLTSWLRGMHAEMSFAALGIKDYKNFLRMKFEKDKLTIYPIALDKVPGRYGWRARKPNDAPLDHEPLIVPARPMKPRLIETPIEITRTANR